MPDIETGTSTVHTPGHARAAQPRNTHVRHKVLAVTMALGAITYLDRVSISVARPYIARDLNLSPTQMGYVFSAFYLAYAVFEIPTGWWGDRVGTRRALTRIVCWWSAFTMLTGFAFNYSSLVAIRFLFGAGEAGAWPNVARTFSRWFPRQERGTAQGVFFMGAHLSGGLTPILVTTLLVYMDWRSLFVLFGSIGFIWAWAWYRWFRDSPAEHPAVGAAEREAIESGLGADAGHAREATQWRRLLANRTVVCLCLMYFTQAFGGTFYVTWLPTYLASRGLWDDGRNPRGVAAHPECRRGSAGRRRHRSSRAPLWTAARTDQHRRRGAGRRRSVHDCRLVRRVAGRGGRADRARRRLVELSARGGVGYVPRHRRPPCRRRERRDEYIRAGGIDPQSDSRRRRRREVFELERAALSGWCVVPAWCALLAMG